MEAHTDLTTPVMAVLVPMCQRTQAAARRRKNLDRPTAPGRTPREDARYRTMSVGRGVAAGDTSASCLQAQVPRVWWWHSNCLEVCPASGSCWHTFVSAAGRREWAATMKPRTASRLAWSIGTFSIAMMMAQLVLMFVDRHAVLPAAGSSGQWTFSNILNNVVNMAGAALGIVLASRRPENPIGWLFVTAGFMLGLSAFGSSYALHALVADPGSLPAGRAFAWASNGLGLIPLGMLAFLFLLFPTGHLRSARWRPAAWFVAGAFTLV